MPARRLRSQVFEVIGAPYGNRTRVSALRELYSGHRRTSANIHKRNKINCLGRSCALVSMAIPDHGRNFGDLQRDATFRPSRQTGDPFRPRQAAGAARAVFLESREGASSRILPQQVDAGTWIGRRYLGSGQCQTAWMQLSPTTQPKPITFRFLIFGRRRKSSVAGLNGVVSPTVVSCARVPTPLRWQ